MTAEIAIINRQAIALAADSAVTVGKQRVWKASNKIFSLGPVNDIAIMIWQSDEFVGFPWEVLIKTFRKERCHRKYATVSDCASDLRDFLRDNRFKADKKAEIAQLAIFVHNLERIVKKVPKTKAMERRRAISDACEARIKELSAILEVDGHPDEKMFLSEYEQTSLRPLIKDIIGTIPESLTRRLLTMCHEIWKREVTSGYHTGVVIAGYGETEFFASIHHCLIDGKDDLFVRSWNKSVVDFNRADSQDKTVMIAFAQSDMAELFMEGVDKRFRTFVGRALDKILTDKSKRIVDDFVHDPDEKTTELAKQKKDNELILSQLEHEFRRYRQVAVTNKILDVVRALPKDEMATMAQAIVEVTALRRKVDSSLESVGGPVDVAIISKSDGFIWVQRKHYFTLDKNQDFLYRKRMQASEVPDGKS